MADRLYLSLWFPNFRLPALAPAIVSVLKQFSGAGHSLRVHAAAAYPISWNEAPFYQRIYEEDEVKESAPEQAVAEATEILHDDFAYEFELQVGSVGGRNRGRTRSDLETGTRDWCT